VALPVNRPLGVLRHETCRLAHLELQPGDRLVLLTDGMLERGAAALDLPDRRNTSKACAPERSSAP
jgi:serine phosphatase RsbU (regulator of sigma subunit)